MKGDIGTISGTCYFTYVCWTPKRSGCSFQSFLVNSEVDEFHVSYSTVVAILPYELTLEPVGSILTEIYET